LPIVTEGAVDTQIVPSDVKTLPDEPGETVFKDDVLLPNKTPLVVNELELVPPLATDVTPKAVEAHVVPSDTRTLPDVPGDTVFKADVLLPNNTPLVVRDPVPVPPLVTATLPLN
jgi:hypothetical protein